MEEMVFLIIEKWKDFLNLRDWKIEVQFKKRGQRGVKIYPDYRYREAIIVICGKDLPLEEYILHELLHLVVGEMTDLIFEYFKERMTFQEENLILFEEDRLVEKLTRLFLKKYAIKRQNK